MKGFRAFTREDFEKVETPQFWDDAGDTVGSLACIDSFDEFELSITQSLGMSFIKCAGPTDDITCASDIEDVFD